MHAQWKNEPLLTKNRGRINSVGRALDCRVGGRGFDSRGRTNTQGLKITEKWRYSLCPESGWTFAWLGWPRKMAVPSPLGGVKYSVPKWYFRAKYIDTQIKCFFLLHKHYLYYSKYVYRKKTSRSCNGTVVPRILFRPFRRLRKYVAILIFYSCLSSASPLAEVSRGEKKNVPEEGAKDGGLARYIKLSAKG